MEIREENRAGYNINLDLTLEEAIKPSILILGDSMFNHVENKDNCMIVAKPGSSLKDTEQLLLSAGGDKVNNVSDVVIALGRNDVELESAETVNDLLNIDAYSVFLLLYTQSDFLLSESKVTNFEIFQNQKS